MTRMSYPRWTMPAPFPQRARLARLSRPIGLGSVTLLGIALLVLAQLTDLVTFALAVHAYGAGPEIGPLGRAYELGGFPAVAAAKLVGVALMLVLIAGWARRTGGGRWLVLAAAWTGVFGAATNAWAFIRFG